MKKLMVTLILCVGLIIAPAQKSHAIVWVVVKAAVKKVIKAIDLKIQRQQNKVIWLQNAQKTIENAMAKTKLGEITDWVDKQRNLYQQYYEELRKVKNVISYYQRIRDITDKQLRLVDGYHAAWNTLRQDNRFRPEELDYMEKVYTGILNESLKNMEQLYLVINSFKTQMSDAKRMELIDAVADKVDENYTDLLQFNRENIGLSYQRVTEKNDAEAVRKLYGIQ